MSYSKSSGSRKAKQTASRIGSKVRPISLGSKKVSVNLRPIKASTMPRQHSMVATVGKPTVRSLVTHYKKMPRQKIRLA